MLVGIVHNRLFIVTHYLPGTHIIGLMGYNQPWSDFWLGERRKIRISLR